MQTTTVLRGGRLPEGTLVDLDFSRIETQVDLWVRLPPAVGQSGDLLLLEVTGPLEFAYRWDRLSAGPAVWHVDGAQVGLDSVESPGYGLGPELVVRGQRVNARQRSSSALTVRSRDHFIRSGPEADEAAAHHAASVAHASSDEAVLSAACEGRLVDLDLSTWWEEMRVYLAPSDPGARHLIALDLMGVHELSVAWQGVSAVESPARTSSSDVLVVCKDASRGICVQARAARARTRRVSRGLFDRWAHGRDESRLWRPGVDDV
jgi:hypothetical protein